MTLPGRILGEGAGGAHLPPPPEMTCGFPIQLVFCPKKTMWFIGVEVEQQTSAPPPKRNPGSAPALTYYTRFMRVFVSLCGPRRGRLFWRKIVPYTWNNEQHRQTRNFLIQGRRFWRSFKNYCNYRYFTKLSRLLSIVKLGIDVLLSEHLQSRCIDSSMYRYTPILLWATFTRNIIVNLLGRDLWIKHCFLSVM